MPSWIVCPIYLKNWRSGPYIHVYSLSASIDLITMLSKTNTMNVQCIKPQWHSSETTKKLFFHSVFVRYNQTDVYSSRGTLVGKRDKPENKSETSTTGRCGLNKTWFGGKATIVNFSGSQIVLGEKAVYLLKLSCSFLLVVLSICKKEVAYPQAGLNFIEGSTTSTLGV